jgi:hypothetical protein
VQQQPPPERRRVRAREVLFGEAARLEQRHRQRIADRQRRRGAGGGREIQRAGLRRHADIEMHVAARQRDAALPVRR